jgi:putative oxidoreductase
VTTWIFDPKVCIPVRFVLGAVFIYSAAPKLIDPPAFAQMVSNYSILPPAAIGPVAIVLPWLEVLIGCALISGFFRRGAAFLSGVLLLTFIAALGFNLARGVPVDCGCFTVEASRSDPEAVFETMRFDILRDLGLLVLATHSLVSPVTWRNPESVR